MNDKLELLEAYLNGVKFTLVRQQSEYGFTAKSGGQIIQIDMTLKEIEKLKNKKDE